MKNIFRLGLLALAIHAPGAYALDSTEKLSMVFADEVPVDKKNPNEPAAPSPLEGIGRGCMLAVGSVEDVRANKETVGGLNFRLDILPNNAPIMAATLLSGDGKTWVESAVPHLKTYGFDVKQQQESMYMKGVLPVQLKLKLAHAWGAGLNLNSHVTIEAIYTTESGTVSRLYHGLGTKGNWWNANSEYMAVLNLGVSDIFDSLARDAALACKAA